MKNNRMQTLTYPISIQPDILSILGKSIEDYISDMQLYTAMQLFRTHKLSLGKAASLAKMDKFVFMHYLSRNNIPVIDYEAEELTDELNAFAQ